MPLQSCLRHAAIAGLIDDGAEAVVLLPRRRRGRAYEFDERRFLTRAQLARLLGEIPDDWRPFFELLASTGLRISEAIALRVMDVDLDSAQPGPRVSRDRRRPAHRPEVPARPALGPQPLRLQRWMGHHSAAFTLDNYGHLIDDFLGPSLDLSERFVAPSICRASSGRVAEA